MVSQASGSVARPLLTIKYLTYYENNAASHAKSPSPPGRTTPLEKKVMLFLASGKSCGTFPERSASRLAEGFKRSKGNGFPIQSSCEEKVE
jgi:hypothetical protein